MLTGIRTLNVFCVIKEALLSQKLLHNEVHLNKTI